MRVCSTQETLNALPDIVVDSPNAAKALAAILRQAIAAKLVPPSVVRDNAVVNEAPALQKALAAALQ